MSQSHIDHIAITAPTLESGTDYVRQVLGVDLQAGGEHVRMGTHNRLLKLGEKCYLEVIAINPNAVRPVRPRWFQLDAPDPSEPIRLSAWIARTAAIDQAMKAAPIALGKIEAMSRGSLSWLISLTEDGSMPLSGIAPALIQWHSDVHPAALLPDSGCRLLRLEGFHPEAARIVKLLEAIGFDDDFRVYPLPAGQKPYLTAYIQTPSDIKPIGNTNVPFNPEAGFELRADG